MREIVRGIGREIVRGIEREIVRGIGRERDCKQGMAELRKELLIEITTLFITRKYTASCFE